MPAEGGGTDNLYAQLPCLVPCSVLLIAGVKRHVATKKFQARYDPANADATYAALYSQLLLKV